MFATPLRTTVLLASLTLMSCTAENQKIDSDKTIMLRTPASLELMSEPVTSSLVLEKQTGKKQEGDSSRLTTQNDAVSGMQVAVRATGTVPASDSFGVLPSMYPDNQSVPVVNTEKYAAIESSRIVRVTDEPVSTFSVDVDTGAYANLRRYLQAGSLPPKDAVRIEELINYFSYDYEQDANRETPFSVTTEIGRTPWNDKTRLLHIGLKGYSVNTDQLPAVNLVFLLDVSGSMNSPDKLGLLKSSIKMLAQQLSAQDRVSIVVYAGASGVVLEPTAGNEYQEIVSALDQLIAGGPTNGHAGIELAYSLAQKEFVKGGVNRVILATDGDFNVGIDDVDKLKDVIKQKRQSGVALTTLGFGRGNYNDHLMEQLADVGDGTYAYIDTLGEARKVLAEELTATLLTIARDVKIQIEFNPESVSEYRLVGYENRVLANEDFNNDRIDAGEIGAGHTVTALYEIALRGEGGQRHSPPRYAKPEQPGTTSGEIAQISLRYKLPGESTSRLMNKEISKADLLDSPDANSDNFRFSSAVAGFGQILRDSAYLESFDFGDVVRLANTARGQDLSGYRAEFIQLAHLAKSLAKSLAAPAHATVDLPSDRGNEG